MIEPTDDPFGDPTPIVFHWTDRKSSTLQAPGFFKRLFNFIRSFCS